MSRDCGIAHRHWCGHDSCPRNEPQKESGFCGAPSDALDISCMRRKGHDGPHQAFTFSIDIPTSWYQAAS